jgi:WD40 repeat protein
MKTTGPVVASGLFRPVQLRLLAELPKSGPRQAAFMDGHERLLTFDSDGTIRNWDTSQARLVGNDIRAAGFSPAPSGRAFATWTDDGTLRVWRSYDETLLTQPLPHEVALKGVVWGMDSSTLLTWTTGNVVRAWNTRTGMPLTSPLPHDSELAGATLSEDGKMAITWCVDGSVRTWSVASGTQVGGTMRQSLAVQKATASADGRIVIAAAGNALSLWFTKDGSPIGSGLLHPEPVQDFYMFSDPLRIVASTGSQDLWWWDLRVKIPERRAMDYVRRVVGAELDQKGALREVGTR